MLLANFFLLASAGLNICLCLDLILMIRNPFSPKEKRVPWYYVITFVIAASQAWAWSHSKRGDDSLIHYYAVWSLELTVIFLVAVYIVSIVYACRKLRGPGISKVIREQIMKRHVLTIGFFIFANVYVIAGVFV